MCPFGRVVLRLVVDAAVVGLVLRRTGRREREVGGVQAHRRAGARRRLDGLARAVLERHSFVREDRDLCSWPAELLGSVGRWEATS